MSQPPDNKGATVKNDRTDQTNKREVYQRTPKVSAGGLGSVGLISFWEKLQSW